MPINSQFDHGIQDVDNQNAFPISATRVEQSVEPNNDLCLPDLFAEELQKLQLWFKKLHSQICLKKCQPC